MQPEAEGQPLGRHLLMECWECSDAVNSPSAMESAIHQTVEAIGATLLHLHSHQFAPQGVTAFGLLAESHLSLHSWPERNYLAVDLFTCGPRIAPAAVTRVLQDRFSPARIDLVELRRGISPGAGVLVEPSERELEITATRRKPTALPPHIAGNH